MDLGWLWHGLGGAGITGVVVGGMVVADGPSWTAAIPFAVPPLLFLGGWAREWRQHWDDDPVMNAHRWIEAAAWSVGGLVAAGVGLIWLL